MVLVYYTEMVSIPCGTIKSEISYIPDKMIEVSIPCGTIKSYKRTLFANYLLVSIPCGTIKRLTNNYVRIL